jgi:hypothetical protein
MSTEWWVLMPLQSEENVQLRTVLRPWKERFFPVTKNMSVQIYLTFDPPEEVPMQNLLHHDEGMTLLIEAMTLSHVSADSL